MPFEYKEHTGEAWLVGIGDTLEAAFAEGAKALFHLMIELDAVEPRVSTEIAVRSDGLETLFVAWLNALIVNKDAQGLVYSRFEIRTIERRGGEYALEGVAWGELLDPERHDPRVDVKAATYSGLKCEKTHRGYEVECVVDL